MKLIIFTQNNITTLRKENIIHIEDGRKTEKLVKTVSEKKLVIDDNMLGKLKETKKIDTALTTSKKMSFNNYDQFFQRRKCY
jgi:hypothetical protein